MLHDTARQPLITLNKRDAMRAHRFIRDQLEIATARMSKRDRNRITRLTNDPSDTTTLSQFHVAQASSLAMTDALLDHFAAHRHQPGFRYWLGTFCLDEGVGNLADGFLDLQRVRAFRHKCYKVLAAFGLHAIIVIEIEILQRLASEASARLMYHAHAACWRYGDPIKPCKLAAAMTTKAFRNSLGAKPIKFTTNRLSLADGTPRLADRITRPAPTEASVAGLARYLTKWPVCLKVLKPSRHHPDRNRLEADRSKNSARMVLALTEARSRLNINDTIQGLGEGRLVRKAWKAGLMQRLR